MAYTPYPMPYANLYNPYAYQQTYNQQQTQPAQQQIQNGGFISVRSIDEARNWPIAPGNSVTFKDESAPYIYTKTMSYNQLDTPKFERFRLVKEEEAQTPQAAPVTAPSAPAFNPSDYATKAELGAVRAELDAVKARMDNKGEKEGE